jgi:osmotically-inducible protein OsmY
LLVTTRICACSREIFKPEKAQPWASVACVDAVQWDLDTKGHVMAIFDFLRNKGQKVFGEQGSQSGSGSRSGSTRSSSGDPRQQQQFSGNTGQQQAGGSSAGGASRAPGSSGASSGSASSGGMSSTSGTSGAGASASNKQGSDAVRDYIMSENENAPDDLIVMFDADDGVVIIEGTVPDEDTAEAIVLIAGDIDGVSAVDDRMRVTGQQSRSDQPRNTELRGNLRSSQGASASQPAASR